MNPRDFQAPHAGSGDRAEPGATPQQPHTPEAPDQPTGSQRADEVTCNDYTKAHPVHLWRQAMALGKNEGRAGDEGEQRAVGKREGKHVAKVVAVGKQAQESAGHLARVGRTGVTMDVAFAQQACHRDQLGRPNQ